MPEQAWEIAKILAIAALGWIGKSLIESIQIRGKNVDTATVVSGEVKKQEIGTAADAAKLLIDSAAAQALQILAEASKTAATTTAAERETSMLREEKIWARAEEQRKDLQVQVNTQFAAISDLQKSFTDLSTEVKTLRAQNDLMEEARLKDSAQITELRDLLTVANEQIKLLTTELAKARTEVGRLTGLLEASTNLIVKAGGSPPKLVGGGGGSGGDTVAVTPGSMPIASTPQVAAAGVSVPGESYTVTVEPNVPEEPPGSDKKGKK